MVRTPKMPKGCFPDTRYRKLLRELRVTWKYEAQKKKWAREYEEELNKRRTLHIRIDNHEICPFCHAPLTRHQAPMFEWVMCPQCPYEDVADSEFEGVYSSNDQLIGCRIRGKQIVWYMHYEPDPGDPSYPIPDRPYQRQLYPSNLSQSFKTQVFYNRLEEEQATYFRYPHRCPVSYNPRHPIPATSHSDFWERFEEPCRGAKCLDCGFIRLDKSSEDQGYRTILGHSHNPNMPKIVGIRTPDGRKVQPVLKSQEETKQLNRLSTAMSKFLWAFVIASGITAVVLWLTLFWVR